MADILKFTGKRVRPKHEWQVKELTSDIPVEQPTPHPQVTEPLVIVDQTHDPEAIAALALVQTLHFYADGGVDGGEQAQGALLLMKRFIKK